MPNPLLSVLLTTHGQSDELELLLDTLLGFELGNMEIILVNDAADAVHAARLRERLGRVTNDLTFFFEHDTPAGRSQSLNEALQQARGNLIWAPLKADRINRQLLRDCIRKMALDPAAFWILDRHLPRGFSDWLSEVTEGTLPRDNRFVLNRSIIPAEQLFFRDRMGPFTAAELAYRILNRKSHQSTDAFFVVDKSPRPKPGAAVTQEFLFSMLRETEEGQNRTRILAALQELDFTAGTVEENLGKLDKALELADEDPRQALHLVNSLLNEQPEHGEAIRLKISLLEKLRRHVEAAELKHEIQKKETSGKKVVQPTLFTTPQTSEETEIPETPETPGTPETPETPEFHETQAQPEESSSPRLSIIIPTTGDGKSILEKCLIHLEKVCDPANSELIVIDNASIDDTFDYLEQLKKKSFLNIRVITNQQNRGFAASANQGINAAKGSCFLLMHNDLFPAEGSLEVMISVMDAHPEIGALGPVVDRCDVEEQLPGALPETTDDFTRIAKLDSCCMLIRGETGVTFHEVYNPAFFEDTDFCRSLSEKGFTSAVATHASAVHRHRVTTDAMGLNLEPELRWENEEIYNARWDEGPDLEFTTMGAIPDLLQQIPLPVNPYNPPGYWLDQIDAFLTDEVKTEIQKRSLTPEDLFNLSRILLAADKRDFLRQIELRIEKEEIPLDLLKFFIRYYFQRNIYSRCRLYLDKKGATGSYFDLYRLRILVAEKESADAIPLLTSLMNEFPCHPGLFRLAGDIHRMKGNEDEARSFYALANQLEPVPEPFEEQAFEIKY